MPIERQDIHSTVRSHYGEIAKGSGSCCGPTGCCAPGETTEAAVLGYAPADIALLPQGVDLGLGCGNPLAIASIAAGETVLDLGSGAGIDCFLAARELAGTGRVIGVDMTPEMIDRARDAARRGNYVNVEFRQGLIEDLPVEDGTVDLIISNCVLNLSPDKPAVIREAFRVLRPGGRLAISDVVATAELPDAVVNDLALYSGCIAGAPYVGDMERWLREAGFVRVRIHPREESRAFINTWSPGHDAGEYIVSAIIEGWKPASGK